jgi:DNA-binding transcriptional ArsR family regulator
MSFDSADRLLNNPVAIRALAHPVRLALLDLVGRDGPMTSSDAARRLDISQALASHHMRQLAKYGFVEPAEPTNGRDRPWRVTATSWRTDPEQPAAGDVLEQVMAEQAVANLLDWQQRRDADWQEITGVNDSLLYLTRDELAELSDAIQGLLVPLAERRKVGDHAARPDDAVPVQVTVLVSLPRPTESGN